MEEETPSLRSVAMGARIGASSSSSLPRIAPLVGKVPSGPLHHRGRPQDAASAAVSWTVDSILPTISADYVLERTNVHVSPSSPQTVADRIVESLSRQSVSYRESDERKNSLLGESHDGLRIHLNLFAAPDDPSTVIVEVQRLAGCSFEFRGVCRDVCRSAKGLKGAGGGPGGPGKRGFPLPPGLPGFSAAEKESRLRSDVDRALDMIQSDLLCTQLMGIELLESLSASPLAPPLVLKDERLLNMLRDLILPDGGEDEEDRFSLSSQQANNNRACQMKRKALAVIANGLSNSPPDGGDDDAVRSLHAPNFVEGLFRHLTRTGEDPHCAAQAARCLRSLAVSSPATKSYLSGVLGVPSILSSIEVKHHLLLEKECGKLRTTLLCP